MKKTTKTQLPAASPNMKPSPVNQAQTIRKVLTPLSIFSSLANQSQSPIKKVSPKESTNKKKSDRNVSFKLLGSKKTIQDSENIEPRNDIYEFTFDPNEEQEPQKKKRKRTVTKKPTLAPIAKRKKVYKSSYDQNISKALAALRNAVKPGKSTEAAKLTRISEISDNQEEINLQEELSFFDEQPVANSSMIVSVRHPSASPWRVEFGSLPIKWPNNAYIKANMTPAVETSFINSEDSCNKSKHVYTNMLPQNDDMFTDVVHSTPNLKQPSIISFIKEMAEKNAKKKRGRSVSPAKAIYQDTVVVNSDANNKSSEKGSDNKADKAVLPVAAKTKIVTSSEAVNNVYEGLKSAADAPVFPEKNVEDNVTNIEELDINDDSQSVHLFEDIEVIHHVKPTRKSYGKTKKVTFRQRQLSLSDSDTQEPVVVDQNDSSDYDDLRDLAFEAPNVMEKKVTKKRKKPKNLRSKKEEKEAEAWAAKFNLMCDDIEEFPLLVE